MIDRFSLSASVFGVLLLVGIGSAQERPKTLAEFQQENAQLRRQIRRMKSARSGQSG